MCVSAAPARFSRTIVYAGLARRDGADVHVLGYEITVSNRSRPASRFARWRRSTTGNAMLLHFPAIEGSMGQANVVDTGACPHILADMAASAFPIVASVDAMPTPQAVDVFEHGIYTVVLARDAAMVSAVLDRVPERRRPPHNEALFDWYSERFPGWPVALCCFDNRDARHATPMLWWYEPRFPELLFAPAIDAHTGAVPDLDAAVTVDHVVLFGANGGEGMPVRYTDALPDDVEALLPKHVCGVTYPGVRLPNGDFVASVASAREGRAAVDRTILAGT